MFFLSEVQRTLNVRCALFSQSRYPCLSSLSSTILIRPAVPSTRTRWPAAIRLRKYGTTDPRLPSTLPKRMIENCGPKAFDHVRSETVAICAHSVDHAIFPEEPAVCGESFVDAVGWQQNDLARF